MRRAALCGGPELAEAASVLGLADADPPEIVIVDARSPDAVERAAALGPALPRVVVADPAVAPSLRALGVAAIATTCEPWVLGPLVAQVLPPRRPAGTRLVLFTAARGGVGRTLLAANLGRRLARERPVWLVDATGTGSAAWWLRTEARGWHELEPLASELSSEHLRVVAAEPEPGLRVIGGPGLAPSAPLARACVAALAATEELALVDAPLLADERTRAVRDLADRVIVLSYDDPASRAAVRAYELADTWLVASQSRTIAGAPPFRALPRDERAVAAALAGPSAVRGSLGRAYDGFAELLSIDAS